MGMPWSAAIGSARFRDGSHGLDLAVAVGGST